MSRGARSRWFRTSRAICSKAISRIALYLDEGTSDAQQEAPLNVYTGKLGGPVAELAELVGEVVSVERTPIRFDVHEGSGVMTIGELSHAELLPYKGPDGSTTTLTNTIFSTVPGTPVLVGKALRYRSRHVALGHDLDIRGHNALQSTFSSTADPAAPGSGGRRGFAPVAGALIGAA
jgi:hypothetical protein